MITFDFSRMHLSSFHDILIFRSSTLPLSFLGLSRRFFLFFFKLISRYICVDICAFRVLVVKKRETMPRLPFPCDDARQFNDHHSTANSQIYSISLIRFCWFFSFFVSLSTRLFSNYFVRRFLVVAALIASLRLSSKTSVRQEKSTSETNERHTRERNETSKKSACRKK